MKDRWNVITRKVGENKIGTSLMLREYVYGDVSDEFTEEKMKNITVIPYEEWQANDFAEILSQEYESANYHNFVEIPYIILRAVREQGLDWNFEDKIMRDICEKLYDAI